MKTSNDFVNWLEGFLDACKNSPSPQQVKEIRKKISTLPSTDNQVELTRNPNDMYTPLWGDSAPLPDWKYPSTITLVPPGSNIPNNGPLDDEFLAAVEANKDASTLDDLLSKKN